jgi:anti-sigma factor RsiW
MDRERDIMHKILDGDADEQEKRIMARSLETDPDVRNDFIGITTAVRMLEQSERCEAPASFTAEVMKNLPQARPTVLDRIRYFLFGSRVLRWNIATALATAVVVIVTTVAVSRLPREEATTTSGQAETTVLVRLTFYSPHARSVAVAGDFNKWKTNADELRKSDGIWSIDLKLKPGVYTYSFIVDGRSWVPDPGAESFKDDGFGSRNAVLRVSI